MPEGHRRHAIPVLVLFGIAALWLRFNAPPPQHGDQFPSDLLNYFYPLAARVAERIAEGQLPLWNPDACSGIPLLATAQAGVFYPGNWISVVVPVERAIPLRLFLECLLGALFTALLFRRWGLHVFACAAGGILFSYACLIGQTFWPPEVATIVWLPWLLLCVELLLREGRWIWWLGLAAGTAVQLLAGFAQFAVYTHQLLLPFAITRAVTLAREKTSRHAPWARLGAAAIAIGLGAGLAAIQILPTLELVGQGVRSAGLEARELHYLDDVVSARKLLANAIDPSPKLVAFDYGSGSGYLGTATLLLALFGVVASFRRALVWLLLAVAVLSFVLSFGLHGPSASLYELYAKLPTVDWFRAPQRLRVLVFFSVIALAAIGFDEVAGGFSKTRRRIGLVAAAGGAAAVGAAGSLQAGGLAAATLLLMAVATRSRSRGPRTACSALLFLVVVADVVHATGRYGSLRSFPRAWSETYHVLGAAVLDSEAVQRIRKELAHGRAEMLGVWPLNAPPILALPGISCYEPLAPDPWPRLTLMTGAQTSNGQFQKNLDPVRFGALYDVASVRHVLRPNPEARLLYASRGDRWQADGSSQGPPRVPGIGIRRWRNDDALPRAYGIASYEIRSREEALEHVLSGEIDFGSVVLLDRDPGIASTPGPAKLHSAKIIAYSPERVEIEVEAPGDELLVLTDTDYPGWRASVDGIPKEILRANGMYRAVAIGPGRHRVVFEYDPASLRWGAGVSAGSFLLLVTIPLAARRFARRRPVRSA